MSGLASRATALVVVLLLVGSPIVGAVGAVAGSASPQDSFAGVPNTNVQEDLPVGAQTTLTATQLQGSVMASDHAETLQVVVTTPERAEGYVNGSAVDAGRGDVALVFRDASNHSGRTVAVPVAAIRGVLGHTPETVHGVHESGDRWADSVEQRNGLLFFEIPKFSSNSVTFEGEVKISANPAADGSKWTYNLGADESVSDPNVTFTGQTNTEYDNASGTGLGDGATLAVDVAGDAEPRGPANGEPEVVLTGEVVTDPNSLSGSVSGGDSESVPVGGNIDPGASDVSVTGSVSEADTPFVTSDSYLQDFFYSGGSGGNGGEMMVKNPPETISSVTFQLSTGFNEQMTVDVYIAEESPDGVMSDGTKVGSRTWTPGSGNHTIDVSNYSPNGDRVTIGFDLVSVNFASGTAYARANLATDPGGSESWAYSEDENAYTTDYPAIWLDDGLASSVSVSTNDGDSVSFGSPADGETVTKSISITQNTTTLDWSASGGSFGWSLDYTNRTASENPAVDLDGDGTNEVAHSGILTDGETASYAAPNLSVGDDTTTISTAVGSTVSVSVNLEEVTKTRDPALTLNGQTVASYAGVLDDGATVDFSVAQTNLKDGQNNLSVAVGDGTLSNDAPTPSVGLEYDHRADVKIDTTYTSNGWEESYNISHTYAGDRENAKVTIPFSRTIYDVRYVDYRVNGGDWITASDSNWHLENGTRLVVEPTDTDGSLGFEAGDELEVRTAGYKVNPINGKITITNPTDPSDSTVDAEFTVDNRTNGFHLEVGGTMNGDRVHYLPSASWTADEEAVLDADGQQDLYLPNAAEGGSARVTTLPLEVGLSSGDVGIHVADGTTPKFKVLPGRTGSGDEVDLIWYDTTSGETYELYSIDKDRAVDKDTAESPVILTTSDAEQLFKIQLASSDSGGSGGSSSSGVDAGGGAWADAAPDGILQQLAVGAAWAGLVVVLVAASGRSDLKGRRRWILVASLSAGSGLFSLEVLRPGSVSGAVNVGLQEVVPLAGLAAIGLVGYSVVTWWQSRKAEASTPETQVTLDTSGGGD